MIGSRFSVIIVLLFGFVTQSCLSSNAENSDALSTRNEIWNKVARSDIIAVGTISVPYESLEQLNSIQPPPYVRVNFDARSILKGGEIESIIPVEYSVQEKSWTVSRDRLLGAINKPAIALLISSAGANYFAQLGDAALEPATDQSVEELKRELRLQSEILSNWTPNQHVPHYAQVASLINQAAVGEQQANAFAKLEELGISAVPAIIIHLDDRRRLSRNSLRLSNDGSHAFESHRFYGPKLMVDALAAILNQITGESFGFIYNGGSEAERAHTVEAWRIYGMRHPAYRENRPSTGD